jgi:catechol 2,3-dioxygenase-like lactoylglutathione lyase family enzyme
VFAPSTLRHFHRQDRNAYRGRVRLQRILETVLYYPSGQEVELARFYGEVLGLQAVGRSGLTFRVGDGLLLLFDAGLSSVQSRPPAHGARGPIHTCFVASADEYEAWKERVTDETGSILEEIEWDNGVRSFYFHDPAGNVLEIADGDLWPES